jgi:hypothetical protein
MTPEQLAQFYEAALTAGSIIFGFVGTFLNFRIQREANYHRQPGPDSDGQDVYLGLSHFTSSLALIILAGFIAMIFGVFEPLAALAHWTTIASSPACIVSGIVVSLILIVGYFFDELFHYKITCKLDSEGWRREWWIVGVTVILAVGCGIGAFLAIGRSA